MSALDQVSTPTPKPHIALVSVHGDPAAVIGGEEAGGQNVYVHEVGVALARLGWQVDMFTRRVNPEQPQIVPHSPGCRTVRLTAGPEAFVSRDQIFDYLPTFVDQLLAFQASQDVHYALVHTNYWLSGWVGMELKRRQPMAQVHTYHSLGAVKYDNVADIPEIAATRLNVERDCLETAERTVATSPQEQAHMRSLVSEQGTIDIIPCGTDIERFGALSQATAREKLGIAPQAKVVFYIGRFDPRKGIETLVRAVAQSQFKTDPTLQLIIGGGSKPGRSDGFERERIEALTQELGIASLTQFPGRISDADLPLYYAAADVSVVPSHYEPFGLVAIEAMASQTPVVASNVGGLQFTVVTDETGILVEPKDDVGFAQALDRILVDPQWCQQLGQAARKRVETKFSWLGVAQQLSDLYRSLLV